jgi:hypothetical protein
MKHFLATSLFGFALALMVAGCSGNSPESIAKELVANMNEFATVLENAKSVDEAKPKIDVIVARMSDLKKRFDAMKMSEAEKAKFDVSMKAEGEKAASRLSAATVKLATTDPLGMMKLGEIMKNVAK